MIPTITPTEKLIEETRFLIHNVPHVSLCAFLNWQCLNSIYQERKDQFLFDLTQHAQPDIFNIDNSLGHVRGHMETAFYSEFSAAKIMLDVAEEAPAVKIARGILEPLFARLEELEAQLLAERAEIGAASHALDLAEAAAKNAAEAALASDPAVAAAREALEKLQTQAELPKVDPPLIRGKQPLALA
jgi:hypothetical protein